MTAHVPVKEEFLLSALFSKQRAAFLRDEPPSLAQRRADLRKLKRALLSRRPQFEAAISKDFGYRSGYETRIMEVVPLIQSINYYRRNLWKWMRPERRRTPLAQWPGAVGDCPESAGFALLQRTGSVKCRSAGTFRRTIRSPPCGKMTTTSQAVVSPSPRWATGGWAEQNPYPVAICSEASSASAFSASPAR